MAAHQLQVLDLTFLRGPNRWSYRPVMEVLVDIHDLEDVPSNLRPDLLGRLLTLLPGLREDGCSYGTPGGFVRRLEEGTWPAHIWEHVTLELLRCCGLSVGFGRARGAGTRGQYYVVVGNANDALTQRCFELGRALLEALYRAEPFDLTAELTQLQAQAAYGTVQRSTARIVAAARRARVPAVLVPGSELVVLGHGRQQRRLWFGETGRTSAIASGMATEEELANRRLSECGVRMLPRAFVTTEEDARSAQEDLGPCVVVRPSGCLEPTLAIQVPCGEAELLRALRSARQHSSRAVVEQCLPGRRFRLLVVSDHVIGCIGETKLVLSAQGQLSLQDLAARALEEMLGGVGAVDRVKTVGALFASPLADAVLAAGGLTPASILRPGEELALPVPVAITGDRIHRVDPDTVAAVALAARALGLDVATVDVLSQDEEQAARAHVVSVEPGLRLDAFPVRNDLREDPLADALLSHLMSGEAGRALVVLAAGPGEVAAACALVGQALTQAGKFANLGTSTAGVIGDRVVQSPHTTHAAQTELLLCPLSDATVLEVTPKSLLREGLAVDRSQITLMTGFDAGALESLGLSSTDSQVHLLRTLIDVVLPGGAAVLNAADPQLLQLADYCDGRVVLYGPEGLGEITCHREAGGMTVTFDGTQLRFDDGARVRRALMPHVPWPLDVWLPAVAVALTAELDLERVLGALATEPVAGYQ